VIEGKTSLITSLKFLSPSLQEKIQAGENEFRSKLTFREIILAQENLLNDVKNSVFFLYLCLISAGPLGIELKMFVDDIMRNRAFGIRYSSGQWNLDD